MFKNKKFGFVLMAVVLGIVLVACGNEGGSGTSGTGGQATGFVQGVTDDAIYFANSVAVSGGFAPVGVPFQAGMMAYMNMINANGGVHGRELRYLHVDDEFNPALGTAALYGFIEDDEVFAIVGHFGTPVIGATFPTLVETGIPTVYFAAGIGIVYNENATDGNGRNTFPVQPVFPMEGRLFAAWAAGEFGAETIGLIRTNDDAGLDFYNGIMQEAEGMGLDVVVAVVEPGAAADVTAQVATILNADVDVIVAGSLQVTLPAILGGLAAQGNTVPVLTSYVNADPTLTALVYDDIGGQFDVFASSWVDRVTTDMTAYYEWMEDEELAITSFAMTGWIAMHFFVQGLERAGEDLTWESFIEAMESAPIQNPFGPAIDFANGNRVGTQDLALLRMNGAALIGWDPHLPFMGIEEILGD